MIRQYFWMWCNPLTPVGFMIKSASNCIMTSNELFFSHGFVYTRKFFTSIQRQMKKSVKTGRRFTSQGTTHSHTEQCSPSQNYCFSYSLKCRSQFTTTSFLFGIESLRFYVFLSASRSLIEPFWFVYWNDLFGWNHRWHKK